FPARNPDLWMHLAQGRSIVQGDLYTDGATVNSSWLFDVACYGLYAILGGTGLVILKAVVIGALAVVLIRLSANGEAWWVAAVCTALALLAIAVRVLFQPATVSYLFLALTLWYLRPRQLDAPGQKESLLPRWPLFVLFVLWANLDGGYVFG